MKTANLSLFQIALVTALLAAVTAGCSDDETEYIAPSDNMLVTGVSPDAGPVAGGTALRVFGTHFATGASVQIGGTAATAVTVVSPTEITCIAPAGTAGTADVVVLNAGGGSATLTGGYTYAVWTNTAFSYRRAITVTGSTAGALTDFQVKVNVTYDASMQADFSDIRFTHYDGSTETEAAFWAETINLSADAAFWVKVSAIPVSPGTTTLYIYYGNSQAVSASNFDAVFDKEYGDSGLLGHWPFDEGSGDTVADGSSNGLDGALVDIPSGWGWLANDGGQWGSRSDAGFSTGSAMALNGAGAHVRIPYAPVMDLNGALTVEAWVKGYDATVSGREEVIASIWKTNDNFSSGWSGFDPGLNQSSAWTTKTNSATARRHTASAVVNGKIYVVAGHLGSGPMQRDIHAYDPATDTWDTGLTQMASDRNGPIAEEISGIIYVIGGSTTDLVESYDPVADTWTTGLAAMPTPRQWMVSGVIGGKIYVAGGISGGALNMIEAYDPATDTWTTGLSTMPGSPYLSWADVLNNELYVVGGRNSTLGVFSYDPVTDGWTTKASLPEPHDGPVTATINGQIYSFSGTNTAATSVYFPGIDAWASGAPIPQSRGHATIEVVNDIAYILGGYRSTVDYASVYAYDPAADGIGYRPDGYAGGAFDGRYVYFAPYRNSSGPHGEILRHDTQSTFDNVKSWDVFNTIDNGIGTNPVCFSGAVFDGRYVYFIPCQSGGTGYSEVLRYDTQAPFDQASSYTTFDANAQAVSTRKGYSAGFFDGRYVIFIPWYDSAAHGEFLRYDTQGAFDQTSSWSIYDPSANSVGTQPQGFMGCGFDGRYLYCTPHQSASGNRSEILRYDTTGDFQTASSFEAFDPEVIDPSFGSGGFHAAVFDGQFVYFVPFQSDSGLHGNVWRYDSKKPFNAISSWSHFNPDSNGVGANPVGFIGGFFDGRYVYFVQYDSSTANDDEILRYDTLGAFDETVPWTTRDIGLNGGYWGAVFDGRNLYLAPAYSSIAGYHGQVAKFDTTSSGAAFKLSWGFPAQSSGISSGPRGLCGIVNTWNGHAMVSANSNLHDTSWHHVALAYSDDGSGTELKLYLDGTLAASTTASGPLCAPGIPLNMGAIENGKALFRGEIDGVRLYKRSLTTNEIQAHYQRRKFADPEPVVSAPGTEETH